MDALQAELVALDRLLEVARGDTGQSRRVAGFLLAWWNAAACGGFDPTDLWAVDEALADDMLVVMRMIAMRRIYPTALGHHQAFENLITQWRPDLLSG